MMMVEGTPVEVLHSIGIIPGEAPVYYERLAPSVPTGKPAVVMLHGGSHSGSCYHLTIDGRPGWAYRFVQRGYTVYVPDWPGCGRSGAIDLARITGETVCQGLARLISEIKEPVVLLTHSMGGALGWRILEMAGESIVATVAVAPGPPGNIQENAQIEAETTDTVKIALRHRRVELRKSGMRRNDHTLVKSKLVGQSQRFPLELLSEYASSLIGTPNRLVYERLNVHGSQVKVIDPARLANQDILVVTPTHDSEHPREFDQTTVDWLNDCGARAQLLWLGDVGIDGNGHMAMIEPGSDEIASILLDWIDKVKEKSAS